MKLSVVVPVYNVESYLRICLDSLLSQDLLSNEYEIILIDDGSTDKSLTICNEYASNHQNIVVYTQENAGASAARNKGLEFAKGEYIFFVDSDDYIEENVLNEIYSKAKVDNCDILFFNYTVIEDNVKSFRTFPGIFRNVIFTGEDLVCCIKDFGSLWKGVYKRKLIQENKLQFPVGIVHEDTVFNFKAYPIANRLMIIDNNVYYYRRVGESSTRTQSLSKLQLMLYSDFVVCKELKDIITAGTVTKLVSDVYEKHCNSILVGATIQLLKNKKVYGANYVSKCLKYSFDNKLYPFVGKTCSWRTYLLSKVLNFYLSCADIH